MESREIQKIREQFLEGLWPQFLEAIEISGLRGWSGQSIHFRYPVTAIVGENGVGKSTVLKVAASAYDPKQGIGYYPSDFFPSTHWDQVTGVSLAYRIRRGNEIKSYTINKPNKRWSFPKERFKRDVYWFDISRILPLNVTAGYARVARLAAGEVSAQAVSQEYVEHLSYILGRNYTSARFAAPDVNAERKVGLLGLEFGEISQFHQGAGESTTLGMIQVLKDIPKYSLVIIDEVEASLHPRAQRRLIEFLLHLSRIKRIQVILSTHSPYILEELPTEARVLLMPAPDGPNIIYGASPEFALSRIDDSVHPEVFVYVEDDQAKIWLREIIASHPDGGDLLSRIMINPVGPSNVVSLMGQLGADGRLPHKSIAILDGDIEAARGCISFPGEDAPERVVFSGLKEAGWPNLDKRFGIGAGTLLGYFEDAMLMPDHHEWCSYVGDRVVKSSRSVWEILATEWCRTCLEDGERNRIIETIKALLN